MHHLVRSNPCKNWLYLGIPNTIEVYGEFDLHGVKCSNNAANFTKMWHITEEDVPVILRHEMTRVTMQTLEFTPSASLFLLGNASFSGIFIPNFHHKSNTKG